jgi:signal transduction histidine kinase
MTDRARLLTWLPGAIAGVLVAVSGLVELSAHGAAGPLSLLFVLILAAAVGCYRLLPGGALAALWVLAAAQVLLGVPMLMAEGAICVVAYGCARYGSVFTVIGSMLSVPLIAFAASAAVWRGAVLPTNAHLYYDILSRGGSLHDAVGRALVLGIGLLVVPWLIGLLVRVLRREAVTRAEQVETARERDQAAELADLREGQARLARDVHDVVGHSLAVILAQAESAQYLPDDDPARLKATFATIAASARSSLQDVRHVLGATDDRPPNGGLDTLIDGVRASGHEVLSTEIGDPRPLPPELATVAYRVLQEMLTNAIRHGRRDEPVRVERHWQDELRIEVSNVVDTTTTETMPLNVVDDPPGASPLPPLPGHGLLGMRRRLESVGGRLDVRPRHGDAGPTFTVTAWLPTGAR